MEDRLGHLNTIEAETKIENEKLAKVSHKIFHFCLKLSWCKI